MAAEYIDFESVGGAALMNRVYKERKNIAAAATVATAQNIEKENEKWELFHLCKFGMRACVYGWAQRQRSMEMEKMKRKICWKWI